MFQKHFNFDIPQKNIKELFIFQIKCMRLLALFDYREHTSLIQFRKTHRFPLI